MKSHVVLLVLVVLALATIARGTSPVTRSRVVEAATPGVEEDEGLAPRPDWENSPAVEATFLAESYAPNSVATLVLWKPEHRLALRLFHVGPEHKRTRGNVTVKGVLVAGPFTVAPHRAHSPIRVPLGSLASGLYVARLDSSDGRLGFAPFVVRPPRLGTHRVLVVLPTYTWQAYNFRDDDRDGKGDTWYADWSHKSVELARPYLARGAPPHFRYYDLPFLHWLSRTRKQVDVFADSDLGSVASGSALARAYDLIVFPGHHEYVTTREYDVVQRYRDLGGNLAFLSANDFFWHVDVTGNTMTRTAKWRDLGRPESAVIGVQYIGTDEGRHRGAWTVEDANAARRVFSNPALTRGTRIGNAGIEIDHTTRSSPRGIRVLAQIRNLFGPGFTAQMTYYETDRGAKVFAAGAFTFAGSAHQPDIAALLQSLWATLSRP